MAGKKTSKGQKRGPGRPKGSKKASRRGPGRPKVSKKKVSRRKPSKKKVSKKGKRGAAMKKAAKLAKKIQRADPSLTWPQAIGQAFAEMRK